MDWALRFMYAFYGALNSRRNYLVVVHLFMISQGNSIFARRALWSIDGRQIFAQTIVFQMHGLFY